MAAELSLDQPPPQEASSSSGVMVYVLPPDEFDDLRNHYPFSEIGLPDPARTQVVVGRDEVSGEIVSIFFLASVLHLEPLWVHPERRKKPGLLKLMWKCMRSVLVELGAPPVFAVLHDHTDIPRGVLSQAVGLGFTRVPGDLYMLNIADPSLRVNQLLDGPTVDMKRREA